MARKNAILAIKDGKERNRQIAFFVVDTLYDMRKTVPPIPPKEYTEFKSASPEMQKKLAEGGFWDNEDVQRFIDKKKFAVQQDKDNVEWLTAVKAYLDKDDIGNRSKLDAKIREIDPLVQPKEPFSINWHEKE